MWLLFAPPFTQWIDESDIYLLVLGGRYGSIDPTSGKSYTHLEYEYAIQQEKPLFSCVLTERAIDGKVAVSGKSVLEMDNSIKLKEFRELVLSKLVKMCDDKKDIKIAVGETLANLSRSGKLIGWVRADNHADMSVLADEIARLSRENAVLRNQSSSKAEAPIVGGLTFDEITELLTASGAIENLYALSDELLEFGTGGERNPWGVEGPVALIEAVKVGVLTSDNSMGRTSFYKVTKDGRSYLSRLKLSVLREKNASLLG